MPIGFVGLKAKKGLYLKCLSLSREVELLTSAAHGFSGSQVSFSLQSVAYYGQ